MGGAYVRCQGQQGLWIAPLPQEKETVHSEIVRNQGVGYFRGEFLAYIQFKERRMAPDTVPPAVADIYCQRNPVRNLFQDHGCHLRDVLYHFLV